MMYRISILILLFAALAGSAAAILPPDASAREPQLRAYMQRKRVEYAEQQIRRQAEAERVHEQTRADIFTPPWMRSGTEAAILPEADAAISGEHKISQKRNHRLLTSIMLLILIGTAVGLVRHVTRDIDKQDL